MLGNETPLHKIQHFNDMNSDKQTVQGDSFNPPKGLRNVHVQTILSSMGPRQFKLAKQLSLIESKQTEFILECGDGVRLSGALSQASASPSKKLAILIHGWEGSIKSGYIISMTNHLLENGIDVFRLNMRDHGDSHHLNEKIFNATMIDEVIGGIENLQQQVDYSDYHLIGFSLGGNFTLRVAAFSHGRAVNLNSAIAFCPVIHAKECNDVLNARKNWVYGSYFVKKWKSSLLKKLDHFPNYDYAEELSNMKTLDEMNQQLIPVYTDFSNVDDYFNAYALNNERLEKTICPCYLHFSKDDMIIPIEGVGALGDNDNLNVTVTQYGGHCGYLSNWKLDSWQDQRAMQIIEQN